MEPITLIMKRFNISTSLKIEDIMTNFREPYLSAAGVIVLMAAVKSANLSSALAILSCQH